MKNSTRKTITLKDIRSAMEAKKASETALMESETNGAAADAALKDAMADMAEDTNMNDKSMKEVVEELATEDEKEFLEAITRLGDITSEHAEAFLGDEIVPEVWDAMAAVVPSHSVEECYNAAREAARASYAAIMKVAEDMTSATPNDDTPAEQGGAGASPDAKVEEEVKVVVALSDLRKKFQGDDFVVAEQLEKLGMSVEQIEVAISKMKADIEAATPPKPENPAQAFRVMSDLDKSKTLADALAYGRGAKKADEVSEASRLMAAGLLEVIDKAVKDPYAKANPLNWFGKTREFMENRAKERTRSKMEKVAAEALKPMPLSDRWVDEGDDFMEEIDAELAAALAKIDAA